MKKFSMNKLIRDRIPEQMLAKGITMHNEVMGQEEFIRRLKDKLREECEEVVESSTKEELLEELADVFEVVQTLAKTLDLSMEMVEAKRLEKREEKGGFEGRILNHHIELPDENPAIAYLRAKQYVEIS